MKHRSGEPTWQAGNAAWWALSVVVTGLAIAALTLLRTVSTVSEEEPATRMLEAALRAPTEQAITDELADAGPDQERLDHTDDLVAFDVAVADARTDLQATIDSAAETRATELYEQGIPGDPGPTRTQIGLPRRLVSALSADNHGQLGSAVRNAAILCAALLGWTLLQGRNDNLLMLPAGALATGWVFATAAGQAGTLLLSDIGPASRRTQSILDQAAAVPMSQLSLATASALAAAAVYRVLTIGQRWWTRRRTVTADVKPASHVEAEPVDLTPAEPDAATGDENRDDHVAASRRIPARPLNEPAGTAPSEGFVVRTRPRPLTDRS